MSQQGFAPTRRQRSAAVRQLAFAAVGGGVGATTLVALTDLVLRTGGARPTLVDHVGGRLGARVAEPGARPAAPVPPLRETTFSPSEVVSLSLLDVGQAGQELLPLLLRPDVAVCLVTTPTLARCHELAALRAWLLERTDHPGRVVAALVDPLRTPRATAQACQPVAQPAVEVPYAASLAAAGPVPVGTLRGREWAACYAGIVALANGVRAA